MMRSLFSGVAGLKTHQTKMDVIGNNIANVNTVAFKSSSVTFNDLMSQTTQRASGPNAAVGTGGVNARQIGLGVKSAAININISGQGSAQSTGNPFDIMIEGDNFFVVSNGSSNFFTRDGSFYVDAAGNLAMTSNGYNVMGWQVDPTTMDIRKDTVSALRVMSVANMTYPPEATSRAHMSGILDRTDKDANSTNGKMVNLSFFDALGYSYTARFSFKRSDKEAGAAVDEYSLELVAILDSESNEVAMPDGVDLASLFGDPNSKQAKAQKIAFDSTNYKWSGTAAAPGTVLQKAVGGDAIVDVKDLFNDDGTLKDRGATVTVNGNADATVQDALDAIAKAYGFEGSTEEFLKLTQDVTTTGAGDAATTTTTTYTIEDMLAKLAGKNADASAPALPTFLEDKYQGDNAEETSFEVSGRLFDGVTVTFDADSGNFLGLNGLPTSYSTIMSMSKLGGNFSDIDIDFSEITEFYNMGTSTIGASSGGAESGEYYGLGTGRRLGDMIGISIQQNGMIYASYDNGMTKLLGQIATAYFANASGLEKAGDNLYSSTLNSGEFDGIGVDITANGGKMSTGQLEMSNVDLSYEFTEMITTQRGFQANSRIITVSDTLLEELTNLKR